MIVLDKYSVAEIKKFVKPLLTKYSADGAILFGSYARGQATDESDIDLITKNGICDK